MLYICAWAAHLPSVETVPQNRLQHPPAPPCCPCSLPPQLSSLPLLPHHSYRIPSSYPPLPSFPSLCFPAFQATDLCSCSSLCLKRSPGKLSFKLQLRGSSFLQSLPGLPLAPSLLPAPEPLRTCRHALLLSLCPNQGTNGLLAALSPLSPLFCGTMGVGMSLTHQLLGDSGNHRFNFWLCLASATWNKSPNLSHLGFKINKMGITKSTALF